MYTQWGSGYANLEAWAEHVWGGAPWVTPTPPSGASATPGSPSATSPATATVTVTVIPSDTPPATAGPAPRPAFLPWTASRAHANPAEASMSRPESTP
jgi:hypothetical protein